MSHKIIIGFFAAFIICSSNIMFITSSALNLNSDQSQIVTNSDQNSEQYAVIMVGRFFGSKYDIPNIHERHYKWYLNDAAKFYDMLKTYGYDDDHIFLLVKLIPALPIPDSFIPIKNNNLIDYTSSKSNLNLVLSQFKQGGSHELDEDDTLIVLLINHGGLYADSDGNEGGINWKSPKIFDGSTWDYEQLTYDENVETYAIFNEPTDEIQEEEYTDWMTLMLDAPTKLRGFRINANNHLNSENKPIFDSMQLQFFNGYNMVKSIELNSWANSVWQYNRFEGYDDTLPTADRVKIRFHENDESTGFEEHPVKVYEFDFWPSSAGYDMKNTYMGCPFLTIPDFLRYLYDDPDTEKIYDYELKTYVENIQAKMIFFLQPCFSGGFIDELSGENRIICTSSRGSEKADSWIGIIREALNFDVDADYNKDKKVSILEAYRYAAEKDYRDYGDLFHPLIDDDGIYPGHYYKESDYIGNGGQEGILASQTFIGIRNPSDGDDNSPKTKLDRLPVICYLINFLKNCFTDHLFFSCLFNPN